MIFAVPSLLFSMDSKMRTNFAVLDSLSRYAADSVLKRLNNLHNKEFLVDFGKHPASWMVEQYLVNKALEQGKKFFGETEKKLPELNINIKEAGVRYDRVKSSDSLKRELFFIVSLSMERDNGILYGLPQILVKKEDVVARDDLAYLESSPYPFAKGKIPEPESSFFDKIAEPVIFISTAIITIALLFSVRSG